MTDFNNSPIVQILNQTFPSLEIVKEFDIKNLDKIIEGDSFMRQMLKDNSEELQKYIDLTEAFDERTCATTNYFYRFGFKCGFKLAIDVLSED